MESYVIDPRVKPEDDNKYVIVGLDPTICIGQLKHKPEIIVAGVD